VTTDFQGDAVPQPVICIPTAAVLEDGTIQLQLTEDGKLILPPGLKVYTADGQEVGSTAAVDPQVQQEQPPPVEDTSNHPRPKLEDSSEKRKSATDGRDKEEG